MNALYRLQSVNTSLVQVVPRLLASWFIVGLGFSVSNFDYFSLDYIDKMSGLLFTVCILLVYFLLSCIQTISKQDCDMIALGLGSTLYAVQLIYANPSGYLLLGIFLFQILYFIYYHKAFLRLSLSIWRSNYRVLIFFSIFAVCSGLLYLLYFFDAKFGTTFLLTNNANLKAYFSDILGDTTFFQILKIGFLEFLFIIYYAKLHKIFARIPINKILFGVLISLPIICTATYVAMITISRYELSRSSTFDMGIFAQMFYNLKEYFTLNTTCERNHLLSHNQIHTSVFYYLLYPIYKLCPNPKTLLVMQASAVAIGFIPLQSICKIYHFSHKQRIAIGFIYTLSAATWGGCFYDFHENVFLVPTLMFLFFFYEKYNASNRTKYNAILTVIMALLVCSIKEDAPLFVIVFGLYLLLGKKEIKLGWSILILGVICMISAFAYLSTVGEGLMTNHYYSLTTNGSIASIFKTLLCNPGYLLIQMFDANKLKFIFTMLLPVGMIPFFTRKYSRFILFIPFVFVNLLTSDVYMYSVFYQYVFATYTFILYLSVLNLKDCKKLWKQALLACCVFASIFSFYTQIVKHKHFYLEQRRINQKQIHNIEELVASIPEHASVSASTFYVPQLSQRDEIYMLSDKILDSENIYQTDYVVFDLRTDFADNGVEEQIALYEEYGYEVYKVKDLLYLVLEAPNVPSSKKK